MYFYNALIKKINNIGDKISICLSICCILHCIALPIFILIIPSFASFWINDEQVHLYLVLLAIPISLFTMFKSLKHHNSYKCISLAGLGLLLLISAIYIHDLGEIFEKSFTIVGATILFIAHFINMRFIKKRNIEL